MTTRIATSPKVWARALGMVAVPMFGPERRLEPGDEHAILLDGPAASLAFAVGDADVLLGLPDPLNWAWSTNLTFSLVLDRSGTRTFVRRWDQPGVIQERETPSEAELGDFFTEVTKNPEPAAETVVEKLLRVFWTLRTNVEQKDGTETDLIRSFNALLVWADAVRRELIDPEILNSVTTLGEILSVLNSYRMINFGANNLSNDLVRSFAAGSMLSEMLQRDPSTQVVLDPDLFIRHASGVLYEAAHISLNARPLSRRLERQGSLFGDDFSLDATPPHGRPSRDIHFTPPSLARTLVQEASRAIREMRPIPDPVRILDPTSGSGVFLVEAAREISSEAKSGLVLRGIDRSAVAQIVTEFCLSRINPAPGHAWPSVDVSQGDSLDVEDWGINDLILMNPPFIAWEDLNEANREKVKNILGMRHARLADYSYAFIAKAIDSLRAGSVVASVVPASILDSSAALPLRKSIQDDSSLDVRLIGKFRGFKYFHGAMVEPALLVIARRASNSTESRPATRVIMAESDHEDKAIRGLRRGNTNGEIATNGWEIYDLDSEDLSPATWVPLPRRIANFLQGLKQAGIPVVGNLFDIRQGLQTGNNPVFVLSSDEVAYFASDPGFDVFFRPAANEIRNGVIQQKEYVFYPYGVAGELLASSDEELEKALPRFYKQRLEVNRNSLANRRSLRGRAWWTLNRPREWWLATPQPKLISTQFGSAGSFAYDSDGRYIVHAGNSWFWTGGAHTNPDLPWAYFALLNSQVFAQLIGLVCPRIQGGQFNLNKKYIDNVRIPNLTDSKFLSSGLIGRLAAFGRELASGSLPDQDELDREVAASYFVDLSKLRSALVVHQAKSAAKLLCFPAEIARFRVQI